MRQARMLALAVPLVLAGCVDDRPFPVAGLAVSSDLPVLPPPNYGPIPGTTDRAAGDPPHHRANPPHRRPGPHPDSAGGDRRLCPRAPPAPALTSLRR